VTSDWLSGKVKVVYFSVQFLREIHMYTPEGLYLSVMMENARKYNFKQQTRGPRGPWVAHLRKRSKVTV